jgi:hypothetical protein
MFMIPHPLVSKREHTFLNVKIFAVSFPIPAGGMLQYLQEVIFMLIDISDAALEQLQDLLSDPDNEGKGVRILVQPG